MWPSQATSWHTTRKSDTIHARRVSFWVTKFCRNVKKKDRNFHNEDIQKLYTCRLAILQLATDCSVRGSNPGVGEIFRTRPARPWGPPSLPYKGYRVISGGNADVQHLSPSSAEVKNSICIRLLPLLTFVPCFRVNFTFACTLNLRLYLWRLVEKQKYSPSHS